MGIDHRVCVSLRGRKKEILEKKLLLSVFCLIQIWESLRVSSTILFILNILFILLFPSH